MDWSEQDAKFSALPAPRAGAWARGVSKTLTNEYWHSLGQGYRNTEDKLGIAFVHQATQSEGDQPGLLAIAENLISRGVDTLLSSPQTDGKLILRWRLRSRLAHPCRLAKSRKRWRCDR